MPPVTSQRGRLIAPNLDDRTWDDLVRQARELIPRYAPQWTDHNPSDLGITLIELFAFLVEGLTFRLNQVPQRNYIAFLNLLGITRDPATPARVYLTFTAQPGRTPIVEEGAQAQTQGSETESPVEFETDRAVRVLPINLKKASVINLVAPGYTNVSPQFTEPPANGSLLTLEKGAAKILALGFDDRSSEPLEIELQFSSPLIPDPNVKVAWVYSTAGSAPATWTAAPASVEGRAAGLDHDGLVRLRLPVTGATGWTAQKPASWAIRPVDESDRIEDELFWIGVKITNGPEKPVSIALDRVLFNSVSGHAALTVPLPEDLGASDGSPFQVFALAHQPLFRAPELEDPYQHLKTRVDGTLWKRVDEFPPGDERVYRVDPVVGEIIFGNFDPARKDGRGRIPPVNSRITAAYRYVVGGLRSNVGSGRVTALRAPVDGITGVINHAASFGASDEEPIEETMRRAPEALKIRDRAVTADDYEYLTREASTDVALVRCLSPRRHDTANSPHWEKDDPWRFAALDRSSGNVYVIIVPDVAEDRIADLPRPEPSRDLIAEVQAYLDKRRDLTAHLKVVGPRYLPVIVTVNLFVFRSAITQGLIRDKAEVERDILTKLKRVLHPVRGGPAGEGWQVGQNVFLPEVFRAAMPSEQIGFISSLTLQPTPSPPYHDPPIGPGSPTNPFDPNRDRPFHFSNQGTWVQLTDYELVCFSEKSTVNAQVTG